MAAASEYVLEPIRDGAEFTLYRARQRGNEIALSGSGSYCGTTVAPESATP